jgi:hypothetical protein
MQITHYSRKSTASVDRALKLFRGIKLDGSPDDKRRDIEDIIRELETFKESMREILIELDRLDEALVAKFTSEDR